MQEKIDLTWVNFFKGLSIIGIFMTHCIGFLHAEMFDTLLYRIFVGGRFGVWVFYMINAVLCCDSYMRNKPKGIKGNMAWIWKKIVRLYPVVFVIIAIKMLFLEEYNLLQIISATLLLDSFLPFYWNTFLNGFLSVLVMLWFVFPIWFKYVTDLKSASLNVLFTYFFVN